MGIDAVADKKIILIAGAPSHGPGDHEFNAGCHLLKKCLDRVPGTRVEIYNMGWPKDESALETADAIFIYADGGGRHPAMQEARSHLIDRLVKKGVGIGCGHYGVEVPAGDPGETMHRWIGGYYEHEFSVNPMWSPDFRTFPDHPVTRGVRPFKLLDEWYFNMRWRPAMSGVTPILVAKPSNDVRDGPYVYPKGPYRHIQDAKGREEVMMWTFERDDGGRGFGFTGGHKHVNWSDDNVRKLVLNALLWIAKVEVPSNGVESRLSTADLTKNLDPKKDSDALPRVAGEWNLEVETDAGTGNPTFEFVQAGNNLVGQYDGLFGTAHVTGSVRGNDISFWFDADYDGDEFAVRYEGTVQSDGTMKGTVEIGDLMAGDWTASK